MLRAMLRLSLIILLIAAISLCAITIRGHHVEDMLTYSYYDSSSRYDYICRNYCGYVRLDVIASKYDSVDTMRFAMTRDRKHVGFSHMAIIWPPAKRASENESWAHYLVNFAIVRDPISRADVVDGGTMPPITRGTCLISSMEAQIPAWTLCIILIVPISIAVGRRLVRRMGRAPGVSGFPLSADDSSSTAGGKRAHA